MSKTISANLKAHMAADVSTLATCWRVTRKDSQAFYFTDHDVDITYDGDVYEAASGMLPQSMEQNNQFATDNMQVVSFLESDKIAEGDIIAGLFDYASLDVFVINYESVADGVMYLLQDWVLGEMEMRDNAFTAEARGKTQHLKQSICGLYSADCRADLGDSECGVSLGSSDLPTYSGSVTYINKDRQIFTDDGLALVPAGSESSGDLDAIYEYGLLTWSTPTSGESYAGANAGRQMEVKSYDPGTGEVELFESMPDEITEGDEFTLTYGCDKAITTCKARFGNVVNFRGEPFVPGPDRMLDIAVHYNPYQDYPNPFN